MNRKSGESLTIYDQQMVMLNIIKAIHAFFSKTGIRYVLLYGSLLGAIRHNGFIPWDNDMDIGVPRPDYDRLLDLLNKKKDLIGEHFYPWHYTTDAFFNYQILRICDDRTIVKPDYIRNQPEKMGVWVDIFPIDGIPNKNIIGLIRRARLFINKKIQIADIYAINGKKDFGNMIGNFICKIFPHSKKRNYTIDSILRKTNFNESEYVGDVEDKNENIIPLTVEDFNSPVLLDFEDTKLYGPKNWKLYLERAYGDYMKLPPIEKRMTHQTYCKWI